MPYIGHGRRSSIHNTTNHTINLGEIRTAGELNFAIQVLAQNYLEWMEVFMGAPPSYIAYNDILGVLEAAKLEFYRRRVAPYEDTKIAENGDVF